MADITVTAGSVAQSTGAVTVDGYCGETITAGQSLYKNLSDSGYFWKSQNDGTAAEAQAYGIALNGGSRGQPVKVQTGGNLTAGATVAVGEIYMVSASAGGIAPEADVGSGKYATLLGVGISTSVIAVQIQISGIQVA